MADFRFAGLKIPKPVQRAVKAIPFLGDAANVGMELLNENEPDLGQRALNSGVVGGGGALASIATMGTDFIPAMMQFVGTLAPYEKDTFMGDLRDIGETMNPETYLREAAYRIGQGRPFEGDESVGLRPVDQVLTRFGEMLESPEYRATYGF